MSIASRVRDIRYAKGWGPDELASRAEISRTALYQIECGKTETPRAATLRRIAQALDVPIEKLLARDESDPTRAADRSKTEPTTEFPPHTDYLGLDRPLVSNAGRFDGMSWQPARSLGVRTMSGEREADLIRMFQDLLRTPLGEGLAVVVEQSHHLLANDPNP